ASVGYFWGFSPVVTIVGFVVFVLLELKERVLTYRISKGFYGNNSTEAIQLLKFIENNIDKIDDGGSGRRRKIFNTPASEEIPGEELGKGVLDARS
ncbi:hypothetical protein SMC61_004353, partial [Cronobacter sakazakii]|nr:hypothetical protein [Cronobacter sakazakii]